MNAIHTLGILLGLSFISGINLYATVAVVGICIKWNLVSSFPPELSILANDLIIGIALILYILEFVADKIPGFDTFWDILHTFIRPLGGAFLAFLTVANGSPVAEVLAFMLGSFISGMAHATKASTRLIMQLSPEPVSNIAASVSEDIFTIGYGYLVLKHPLIGLICTITIIVLITYFLPKLSRLFLMMISIIYYNITGRYRSLKDFSSVPQKWDECWKKVKDTDEKLLWAGPAFVKTVPGMARFKKGYLIISSDGLYFYTRRLWRIKHAFRRGVAFRWKWEKRKMVDICRFDFGSGESWSFYMLRTSEEFFRARMFSLESKE